MSIDYADLIDAPFCLCHAILKTQKTKPTWSNSQPTDYYQLYCRICGFKTSSFYNRQAAIADWFYSNRAGDAHIKSCWIERYNRQQGTSITGGDTLPQRRALDV